MSLIGRSIGNYQIKAKLGEGGMGAVYLGEHPLIGKRVAVKVLLDELASREDIVQRFFNEAKAVNDIGHQNIVDVVDFGRMTDDEGKSVVYFIMEFLEGQSLQQRLRTTGVSPHETLHIMQQCCSALAASHQKGIVHRDLKPDNIYLIQRGDDRNFVKILDFGIAKLNTEGPGQNKTRTGAVIGTPSYMSPEQCEGRGNIDSRSDVYSLGVVMFEMMTGRLPFLGEGFGEIIVAHITQPVPAPSSINPGCPPELESIVLHALEKPRESRFQTMSEFAAALRDPAQHLATNRPIPGYTPNRTFGSEVTARPTMVGDASRVASSSSPGPRPNTTLSGAAAELGSRTRAPSGGGSSVLLGAAAVLLLGGGGGFWFWKQSGASPATPPPGPVATTIQPSKPDAPTTPVAPQKIKVRVTSEPSGASVFRSGTDVAVGTTPYTFELQRGSAAFFVELKLAGFKPTTASVATDLDKEIALQLIKDAVPQVPSTGPVATSKSSKPAKATKPQGESTGTTKKKLDDLSLIDPKF